MKKTPDVGILKNVFSRFPDIQAVYIFGSTVSGKIHQESDLDLAIITSSGSLRSQKVEILATLASYGFCDVDLVFPTSENIVLLFETVRSNRLIYQQASFSAGSFFSKVLRQYFDFYPYLSVQRQAYKKRILHGTS